MIRKLTRIKHGQRGITGLETAIILIAFVVVASVFAYTVLSAGLFSTEEANEAITTGLEEAQSTLEIKGAVTAYADLRSSTANGDKNIDLDIPTDDIDLDDSLAISKIEFMVACMSGGESIDLTPPYAAAPAAGTEPLEGTLEDQSQTIITYTDSATILTECAWTAEWIGTHNDDWLLDQGEKAKITVYLVWEDTDWNCWALGSANASFMDDAAELVGTNHTFMLEMKAPAGAVLTIERTTPGYLDTINDLS